MRQTTINRKTGETTVKITINLDGAGRFEGESGCGFFDHMLMSMTRNAKIDVQLGCQGDTWVDDHHSVEDIGISFGQALKKALGEKRGIGRYGNMLLPMDETLCMVALDVSGRAFLGYEVTLPSAKVGTFDTELVREFFWGVVRGAELTLHIRGFAGENTHHIIEGIFKGFGRALRQAVAIDEAFANDIPSTKGVLGEDPR